MNTAGNDRRPRRRHHELVRAAWGLACLAAPGRVVRVVGRTEPDHRSVLVTRVLGARHLAQGLASWAWPTRPVLLAGGVADLAHSASMAGLALLDDRRRALASTDAGIAGSWGAVSLRDARH